MLNPFREINWRPDMQQKRSFGRSLMIGFPTLAAGLLLATGLWSGSWRVGPFLGLGAGGLAAGALFVAIPSLAKPFYLAVNFLACCIGAVVGNTLLVTFYLLILTPFGVIMRMLGRKAIQKSFDRNASSYWVDVEKSGDAVDYYRQF